MIEPKHFVPIAVVSDLEIGVESRLRRGAGARPASIRSNPKSAFSAARDGSDSISAPLH